MITGEKKGNSEAKLFKQPLNNQIIERAVSQDFGICPFKDILTLGWILSSCTSQFKVRTRKCKLTHFESFRSHAALQNQTNYLYFITLHSVEFSNRGGIQMLTVKLILTQLIGVQRSFSPKVKDNPVGGFLKL